MSMQIIIEVSESSTKFARCAVHTLTLSRDADR